MNGSPLSRTTARDETLTACDWAGLTVISRSASHTPEDIFMPETGVGISFIGDERSHWRIGAGRTRTSSLANGSVFVFAGEEFVWAQNANRYSGVALGFDSGLLKTSADRAGMNSDRIDLRHAHFQSDDVLLSIATLMDAEIRTGGLGGPVYQDSLATVALIHVLRQYAGVRRVDPRTPTALSPSQIAQVTDLMTDRMAAPLRLEELAASVGLSPFHFSRSFRQATGQPPHRFLTALRMERARTLLASTDVSVATVACRVGFTSPGHFATQFRRYFGVTPSQFRKR